MTTKKVCVFIDGYNLYHAVHNLNKPKLKWVNLKLLAAEFARPENGFEITSVKFFTAPPTHKPLDVQSRYAAYISALKSYGIEVIEGKFKKKLITTRIKGQAFTRTSREEKETDVNIAISIVEAAFENKCDKILVITNDSDISPAIRMARAKNPNLTINVITPPLLKTKNANYDLLDASGDTNKNRRGQIYFKTRMIKEQHLLRCVMPDLIVTPEGLSIQKPTLYN